jgi:hypothetical protein
MRGSTVSREIENFSLRTEISTLKSELSTMDRHVRVLTSSVFIGHDELYDELYLHTGIVISSITKVDLIRALRFLVDEGHVAARSQQASTGHQPKSAPATVAPR